MVTILMISFYLAIVVGITIYAIRMKNKAELAENAFKGLLQNYQEVRELNNAFKGLLQNYQEVRELNKKYEKEKYECIEKERPEPGTLVRQSLEGENIKEWALNPGITSIVTSNRSFSSEEKMKFGKQAYKCIKEGLPLIFFREDGQEVP
jgi:hypothetical protein